MKYTFSTFIAYLLLVFAILICCAILHNENDSYKHDSHTDIESCNDYFSASRSKSNTQESEITCTTYRRTTNHIVVLLSIVICLAIFFSRKIAINFFNKVIHPIHRTVSFIHNSDGAKDIFIPLQ